MGYENGSGLHGGGEDSDRSRGYLGEEGREGVLGDEGSGDGGKGDGETLAQDGGSGGAEIPDRLGSGDELEGVNFAAQGGATAAAASMGGVVLSHIGNALYAKQEGHKHTCIGSIGGGSWKIMGQWTGQEIAREIVRRWNVAGAVERCIGKVGE